MVRAMDYTELYQAWQKEKDNRELQVLEKTFYAEVSEYVKSRQPSSRDLEKTALRARLEDAQRQRIERMVKDLVRTRYEKLVRATLRGKRPPRGALTAEEEIIYSSVLSTAEELEKIRGNVLHGQALEVKEVRVRERPKRILVRFLQAIPAIVGPNMRVYGPFKAEDVASLPAENAEGLIEKNVVVEVRLD
jgi:DNA replication factor GINS